MSCSCLLAFILAVTFGFAANATVGTAISISACVVLWGRTSLTHAHNALDDVLEAYYS